MPFQTSMPDAISSEESEALARFVHDLESRMERVADLLHERGTPSTATLAATITRDLQTLESLLTTGAPAVHPEPLSSYVSAAH